MSKELSYINESGDSVYTSQYLTNRKSCCKTFCLHCPYGTTLEKFSLVFKKITTHPDDLREANSIIKEDQGLDTLGSSMIDSAFGGQKKTTVSKYNADDFIKFTLKGYTCGLARIKKGEIKEVFLKTYFKDQGIDQALVSSLYSEAN